MADTRELLKIFLKKHMELGYKEMAEINLQLSEVCFAVESEAEKFIRV